MTNEKQQFCQECGWELLSQYELVRGICSGCLANDHRADIDWEEAKE